MRDLIQTIFGVYTPVTYEVLGTDGAVLYTAVADGAAGVDWTYVAGVFLLPSSCIPFSVCWGWCLSDE